MKKFLCIAFCLVLALTASAVNVSDVDYTPPPKIESVSIAPAMEIVDMPMVDVQYLNVIDAPIVFVTVKDAPVTSQMASALPMCAYIETRNYNKKFLPPESYNRKDMRQHQLNMSRYHNKLH